MELWIFNNTDGTITLLSGCGTVKIKEKKKGKFNFFCSPGKNIEIKTQNKTWEYDGQKLISKTYHNRHNKKGEFITRKRLTLSPKYKVTLQIEKNGILYIVPLKKKPPINCGTEQLKGFPIIPMRN
jgi:hypothetical protein